MAWSTLWRESGPLWEMRVTENMDPLHGLPSLPANSVDAIVTDPPAGIGFMGKSWDKDRGGRAAWVAWLSGVMREAMRVLKPGGYALVWALPRTSHWTAWALEDAGWWICDRVVHIFGNGFPKSTNISKAIDRKLGRERAVIGANPNHRAHSGVNYEGVYAGGNTGAAELTAPASEEAARWHDWHTALKPAYEDWWLVQKPFKGTFVDNIRRWGTGALNIGACRVQRDPKTARKRIVSGATMLGVMNDDGWKPTPTIWESGDDGWPQHLVFTHDPTCAADACVEGCPVAEADRQKPTKEGGASRLFPRFRWDTSLDVPFLYQAKAPRSEKDEGVMLARTTGGEATGRQDDSAGTRSPRAGAGRQGGARNTHPTVKSVALMRWLCRLVTPPGGTVLDMFGGSGTTGVACVKEGFHSILMERGQHHALIMRDRLVHAGGGGENRWRLRAGML